MKLLIKYSAILLVFLCTSCFEDREALFKDTQIEFENAVMLAKASGQNFPIINLTRASGTPAYQVNLIGRQLSLEADIAYSLDVVPAALLNATTIAAVEGVHFNIGDSFTFPEDASKADFTGLTIEPGFAAQPGMTALLIIKLDGNNKIGPAENYRRLGFRINLN